MMCSALFHIRISQTKFLNVANKTFYSFILKQMVRFAALFKENNWTNEVKDTS